MSELITKANLDALRAERDALKGEVAELLNLDQVNGQQIAALQQRVAELEALRQEERNEFNQLFTASRASEARAIEALKPLTIQRYSCIRCGNTQPAVVGIKGLAECPCGYLMGRIDPKPEHIAALDSSTALAWLEAREREAVENAISAISTYRILIITEAVGKSAMDGSETVYIEVDKEWLRTTAGLTAKDEPEEKV